MNVSPTCAVITPVGPGHEESWYKLCLPSIEHAINLDPGPFTDIKSMPIFDTAGELGRSRARNMGVAQAQAENFDWIFFLDADDLLFGGAFEAVQPYLKDYAGIWGNIVESQFPELGEIKLRENQVTPISDIKTLISVDPFLSLQMGHFVKTEVALANPFDEQMNAGEDFKYYLQVWRANSCIKCEEVFFVNVRGNHSHGPKSANGQDWRLAVKELFSLEREGFGGSKTDFNGSPLKNRNKTRSSEKRRGMLPRVDLIRADENDWMLLNSPDHITEFIRKNGFWGFNEATIAKVFVANRENTNILDVGANIGGFTLPVATAISSSNGKVYAFEPQRIVFQQFCANVFVNRLDNVHAYNLALGDRVCEIQIPELDFWQSQNVGGFSIDAGIRENISNEARVRKTFLNSESSSVYTVEQRTLDSFKFDFEISLIKVDVEGYELEFFRGGEETIKSNSFPPIIFELWDGMSWYEEKAHQTKEILVDWGYEFNEFDREILAQHPSHPVQCKVTQHGDNINLSII